MKVLIACEFSGIVRRAFEEKGHDAISCDLIDTEIPGNHYKGNVLDIINEDFDLMIAHPPCTYLCVSGNRWLKDNTERTKLRDQAIEFAKILYNSKIPKIVIENPIGILSSVIGKPTQIIQPYQFGHCTQKSTCLWIKGLKPLEPTNIINLHNNHKIAYKTHWMKNNKSKNRSRTFVGIAEAMASQWG